MSMCRALRHTQSSYLRYLELSWNRSKALAYSDAWSSWTRRNPGWRRHEYDIASLVNEAFVKVYWMECARNWLFCTGCIRWTEMFVTIWISCRLCRRTLLHLQVSEPPKMKWLTLARRQQAVTVTCRSHENVALPDRGRQEKKQWQMRNSLLGRKSFQEWVGKERI